ncbi:Guanine nucleotide exchange factor lte1 [Nowakowskiella sp. JEL0407]|nr:Guanine nucleotide exchange factor lte1 [Nowakowskiella sp. JEL0407]
MSGKVYGDDFQDWIPEIKQRYSIVDTASISGTSVSATNTDAPVSSLNSTTPSFVDSSGKVDYGLVAFGFSLPVLFGILLVFLWPRLRQHFRLEKSQNVPVLREISPKKPPTRQSSTKTMIFKSSSSISKSTASLTKKKTSVIENNIETQASRARIDESEAITVVAKFPFTARSVDEVSFCRGDVVNVVRIFDDGWAEGVVKNHKALEKYISKTENHSNSLSNPAKKRKHIDINLLLNLTSQIWTTDKNEITFSNLNVINTAIENQSVHSNGDENNLEKKNNRVTLNAGKIDIDKHELFIASLKSCYVLDKKQIRRPPSNNTNFGKNIILRQAAHAGKTNPDRRFSLNVGGMSKLLDAQTSTNKSPNSKPVRFNEKQKRRQTLAQLPEILNHETTKQAQNQINSKKSTTKHKRYSDTLPKNTHAEEKRLEPRPTSSTQQSSKYSPPEELIKLLQKDHFERTPKDIQRIYKYLIKLRDFADLSEFVLTQVCGVVHLNIYEKDRVVFSQGEVGTCWYVILEGSAGVLVSESSGDGDSVVVARKSKGEGFGELALVNDAPRAATILTTSECYLLRVEKADYNRILRFIHNKEQKEKMMFIRKIPFLSNFTDGGIMAIADVMSMKHYKKAEWIVKESEPISKLYIICRGSCDIYKRLSISTQDLENSRKLQHTSQIQRRKTLIRSQNDVSDNSTKIIQVKMGSFEEGEYFGESAIIADGKPNTTAFHPVSVRCATDVVVGELQVHDGRTKLRRDITMTPYSALEHEDIVQKYEEYVDFVKWLKFKGKILDTLRRERNGCDGKKESLIFEHHHVRERLRLGS